MTGVDKMNIAHSPRETEPAHILSSKNCRPELSFFTNDMYTMPMMKIGMAVMMEVVRRKSSLRCSFSYILRVMSSVLGACHIETVVLGGADAATSASMVRMVKFGGEGV